MKVLKMAEQCYRVLGLDGKVLQSVAKCCKALQSIKAMKGL